MACAVCLRAQTPAAADSRAQVREARRAKIAEAQSIVASGAPDAKSRILDMIGRETAPESRSALLGVLEKLGSSVQAEDVKSFLADPAPLVRSQAVRLLAGQAAVSPAALAALGDLFATEAEGGVRMSAAFWLGEAGGASAVPALQKALVGDKDANVRIQAAHSLKRIGNRAALAALRGDTAERDPGVRSVLKALAAAP